MDWPLFVVQWLHVLLGVLWFGYALSVYFLVSPAIAGLPEVGQRDANYRLATLASRVLPMVSGLVLLLGIVRGTLFGPITSLEALLGTAYGLTFLVALVVTVGLMVHGARFLGPAIRAIKDAPDFASAGARVRRLATIDLAGFFVVFTCMILMRFDL